MRPGGKHALGAQPERRGRNRFYGVSTLLCASAIARRTYAGLALVNVKPSHAVMLAEARLAAVFAVFKTEQGAVNSIFPHPEIQRYDLLAFIRSLHPESATPVAAL
jgi:hypothetical protein